MSAPTTVRPAGPDGIIGRRSRKVGGDELLTGRVRYLDDHRPTGTLHAVVVRSDQAHARIDGIDATAARAMPGVQLVLDGRQAAELSGPIPYFIDPAARGGRRVDIRCLAVDTTVFVGQPVAAVVATTRAEAEAAAAAVRIRSTPLPHVLDAVEALRPDAPRVYDEWPDNVVFAKKYGIGDVDAALAAADVVVTEELHIARTTTAPMEPRGYLASWDPADETLTVHAACQNPHQMRWMLSASLGLDETRIRIVTTTVGGSFGLKMQGHPEETLIALLSQQLGRPVKWVEDRRECFMAGAREQVHRITVGATRDGRILGLRNAIVADTGALSAQPGWAMPNMSATTLPSGYAVQACDIQLQVVATNKPSLNAARGFGKDAAHFVMERIVDVLARRLGMDPAEIRRRNFVGPDEMPYRTSTGLNIDSGDFPGLLDKTLAALDYDALRERQRQARDQGRHLGIGLAFELTPESSDGPGTFVSGFDTTTVRMSVTGSVTVLTGVTTPGGGNDTGIAQIVAQELGVPIGTIRVIQGDTDQCPNGFGNFSGRSMVVGGGSAALAARDVRAKIVAVAARMLSVDPDDLDVDEGIVTSRTDPATTVPVAEVAITLLTRAFAIAKDIEPVLESTRAFMPGNIDHTPDEHGRIQPYPTYSSCLHGAVVEVDPDTGKVTLVDYVMTHDCGTMINPSLVEGQATGAIVMGLGTALSEQLVFDDDGALLSDRFKSYLLMRAGDLPELRMVHQVTPSPFTVHGNKGAGEAGIGGAQAAVANAVEDALSPFGVTVRRIPLTPPEVLRVLDEAAVVSS
ncbi:xanthine dehydrogenase family protein molybdopterin-binding subunit [Nakamurella leprariae]|uniref:Xanthine dehydrogenase family protein n=1 Tax=Nakamurella leprariae TaxID=2803911 RepID=A0A938YEP5_9ACTN|nr:xanthine dehydrogenase family protein molybdopterin-binding subunit [Nakamurella leprariae]MBM9466475.1 xanthine dehydrogenase family protein [Nakamurella leprariae]